MPLVSSVTEELLFSPQEVVGDRIPFRIGGIEIAHDGANWLVLGDGKSCGGIEIGRWLIGILETEAEAMGFMTSHQRSSNFYSQNADWQHY